MKKCKNCGREMLDIAKFCPKCGVPQLQPNISNSVENIAPVPVRKDLIEHNIPIRASKIGILITFIGIVVTIFSVFSPVIVISGFRYMVLTLMDFSKWLSLIVLTVCFVSIYGLLKQKYELITVMSNALMLYFITIIGIYLKMVSQAYMVFLDIVIGGVIFFFGVIIMEIGGVVCGLSSDSTKSINIFSKWFHHSKRAIVFYKRSFSGLLVSVTFGVIMVLLTFAAEIFHS